MVNLWHLDEIHMFLHSKHSKLQHAFDSFFSRQSRFRTDRSSNSAPAAFSTTARCELSSCRIRRPTCRQFFFLFLFFLFLVSLVIFSYICFSLLVVIQSAFGNGTIEEFQTDLVKKRLSRLNEHRHIRLLRKIWTEIYWSAPKRFA